MADGVTERDRTGSGWLVRSLGTLLGAISLVGGLTWILLNLQGPSPVADIGVGVVLAGGGLILLMPHRVRLPRTAAWIAAGAAGVVGTAAGVLSRSAELCCMYAYVEQRGFPYRWLTRGGVADDPETARTLAVAEPLSVDVPTLAVNVLIWAYAGLVLLTVITLLGRLRSR